MKKSLLYFLFIIGSIGAVNAQTVVTFYTTLGDFEVELYDELKPITAGNFLDLVEQEFYDGIIFHRVISNFVIQGGDPTGTGYGGPGYTIEDEFDASLSNTKKTLSMANAGPNTGGSQFFINLKDNIHLDFDNAPLTSAHPVFGEVISGWEIVELIENVPVDGNNRPITEVVMNEIRVTQPLGLTDFDESTTSNIIYPNPVTKQSIIEINSNTAEMTQFTILNMNSTLISSQMIPINQGVNQISLSDFEIENLPIGVYFMTIKNKQVSSQRRFIIAK